jgi:hypothetical protein
MLNRIAILAASVSSICFAADSGEGSAAMPTEGATSPRVLPDLSEASRLAADVAKDKATRKAGKPKAKANVSPTVKSGVKKALKESVEVASDRRVRLSKSGPLLLPLHKHLATGAKHIAVLAKSMKCSEQDVRGAIDNLRRLIHPVNGRNYLVNKPGGVPKTFGYKAGYKLPKDIVTRIGGK